MVGVGIVVTALGYTVVYYGAELWAGRAVSIASASGFAAPPKPVTGSGNSGILGFLGKAGSLATRLNTPLLFFI